MTEARAVSGFSDRRLISIPAAVQSYSSSLAFVTASTLIGFWIVPGWGGAPVAMIYTAQIFATAALWGIGPALFSGTMAALAYDFFFTEPVRTFRMDRGVDIVTVLLLLGVALVASRFAAHIRRHLHAAAADTVRNAAIAHFASRLLSCGSEVDLAWAACAELHRLFRCNVLLVTCFPQRRIAASIPRGVRLTPSDVAAAAVTVECGQPAGRGIGRVQPADWQFFPVRSTEMVQGAVGLARDDGRPPVGEPERLLLSGLLEQLAIALVTSRRQSVEAKPLASIMGREPLGPGAFPGDAGLLFENGF